MFMKSFVDEFTKISSEGYPTWSKGMGIGAALGGVPMAVLGTLPGKSLPTKILGGAALGLTGAAGGAALGSIPHANRLERAMKTPQGAEAEALSAQAERLYEEGDVEGANLALRRARELETQAWAAAR